MADDDLPLSLDEIVEDFIVGKPDKPAKPRTNGKAASSGDTAAPEGAADEGGEETPPPRDPARKPEGGEEPIEPVSDEPEGESPDGPVEDDDEDPVYEVRVDGKTQDVKLSQLLATWSGENTIAARLQEATEARNAAARARDIAVQQERGAAQQIIESERAQLRQQIDNLAAVYTHYGDAILAPRIEPPDPAMRMTDPIGYLTQMEAYRSETDRLAAQRQHMIEVQQASTEMERQQQATFVKAQAAAILQEVPAMADETYRRAQVQRVKNAARSVGFSDDEVRYYTSDRRAVYLGMLAAVGLETLQARGDPGKAVVAKPSSVPAPTARVRTMASVTAKRKAARERARSTGSVEDVAQTLIVSAPRSREGRRPRA